MFLRVIICMFALIPITNTLDAGVWDHVQRLLGRTSNKLPQTISVLVLHDQPGVMLEVTGKYHIYDPHTNSHVSSRLIGKRKFLQPLAGGLKWGEEFPGIYQLHIVPDNRHVTSVVNGVEYRGTILVYDVGGTISIVNKVDIEDYLLSTLSPQFQEPLPEETLSAIAIAARTMALFQSQHPKNPYWAVDAKNVGYEGIKSVNLESDVAKAIRVTENMVLSKTGSYEGLVTPIAAQWGSITGGKQKKERAAVFSRISLYEAEEMGYRGKNAAQILTKGFPDSHIEILD